jgi:lysozyme
MITQNIIDLIKKHEGLCLEPYKDTLGCRTIGYGHLIKPSEDFTTITPDDADSILRIDLQTAYDDACSLFPNIDGICEARKAVLIDLSFNLGKEKLSHFHNFIAAVIAEKFVAAAYELRNSLWFGQVGNRGEEDRLIMLTGEFQV